MIFDDISMGKYDISHEKTQDFLLTFFNGLVKLPKQRSKEYESNRNLTDISIFNLEFWDFPGFSIGNPYTALASFQRPNLVLGGQVL